MNRLRRAAALVVSLATLLPSTVLAQAAKPPEQAAPPPVTFRAGVELVRLDVRVVDGKGLPIKDLRQDEIKVLEGDVERPVVLFQRVAEPEGTYLEAARRTIGAEVSTNQGAPRGHLYVFVFDQAHISPGNEVRARQAVDKFLRTRVKPGDRVALYAVPGPGPQLPFSSNVALALSELPKVRGALDRDTMTVAGSMNDFEAFEILRGNDAILQRVIARATALGAPNSEVAALDSTPTGARTVGANSGAVGAIDVAKSAAKAAATRADTESHTFLLGLADVITQLAVIEGRKSVILVSEGFFPDNLTSDIDRVAAAAAEAYAVIYSLDINRRGVDISAEAPTGGDPAREIQGRLESLGTLSAETSGELVLDVSGRGEQVLNQIADTSQDYYIVGFEPPASALADRNRYRRIRVRLSRPGARVATRTGYALRDPVTPADRRRSIDSALSAPFPQQGLPLEMTTYVLRGSSVGVQRVVMSLQAELPVASGGTAKSADVVFIARDARDGRVRASGTDTIPLPRAATSGRTTARGQFRVQFELPAGDYLMRAAVREPGGLTGTVDRRFDVKALDGVDITASDLIIGRRADALPVRAKAYANEGLTGALEVYARAPGDLDAVDVTVDLVPTNGDAAVRSVRADLADVRRVGNGAGRPAQVLIPLDGVAAGDYVARARVRARGETAAELIRQVEVVAGPAPADPAPPAPEAVTPQMILGGELGRKFVSSVARSATDPAIRRLPSRPRSGRGARFRRCWDAWPRPAVGRRRITC